MTNDLRVLPPQGALPRLKFYSQRYGFIHAVCRYVFGNWSRKGWRWIGPFVTRRYLKQWCSSSTKKIVNLGGGGNCLIGCLTIDVDPRADCFVDLRKDLPFSDGAIDGIFCEEFIEHVSKSEGERLLKECFRVLCPGGIMRITTPDLDYLAARINEEERGADNLNHMFYEHGHRYLYSRRELRQSCERIGFIHFTPSTYREVKSRFGYLDSHADRFRHLPEVAQYAEMQKPT